MQMNFPIWKIRTTDEKEHYIIADRIVEAIRGLEKIDDKGGFKELEIHSVEFLGELTAISDTCVTRMKDTAQFVFSY
jgi:hypothetical protein